ncbi:response regulator [bacterium]|nr:response regulator [bacterium]
MKILTVDDNNETLILLSKLLSPFGECVSVNNGKEAIRLFELAHEENKPFHLIFLDIMMPGMDGHEVLKTIRRLENEKYSPESKAKIAMLTALGNPKNRFNSFEEGCEYYIVKPIIKTDILEIINKTKEWFEFFS